MGTKSESATLPNNDRNRNPKSHVHLHTIKIVVVVVVVLFFYVPGKHLGSCRDGQLTTPHFSWAGLDLLSG